MNGIRISEFRFQNSEFRRRGFTLVEILVVIAIILILVAMVVTIGTAVRTNAHRKQTIMTLNNLRNLLEAYTADGGSEPAAGANDFVTKFLAYPATKRGMASLPPGVVTGTPPSATVVDGFGKEICFEPTNWQIQPPPPPVVLNPGPARFRSFGPDGVSWHSADGLTTPGTPAMAADDILSGEVQ